jgi:hypothetical protein
MLVLDVNPPPAADRLCSTERYAAARVVALSANLPPMEFPELCRVFESQSP